MSNTSNNQIKPCPKCGDAWLFQSAGGGKYKINCKCGHAWENSLRGDTRDEVVEHWNGFVKITNILDIYDGVRGIIND